MDERTEPTGAMQYIAFFGIVAWVAMLFYLSRGAA